MCILQKIRGSLQDCVAGLPGPFHLERDMSLVSCSFHTSGPTVAVPAPCRCPCLLGAHHGLPVPVTPVNTEAALDQWLALEGAPVNPANPQTRSGSHAPGPCTMRVTSFSFGQVLFSPPTTHPDPGGVRGILPQGQTFGGTLGSPCCLFPGF